MKSTMLRRTCAAQLSRSFPTLSRPSVTRSTDILSSSSTLSGLVHGNISRGVTHLAVPTPAVRCPAASFAALSTARLQQQNCRDQNGGVNPTTAAALLGALAAAATVAKVNHDGWNAECCGIAAVVGTKDHDNAREFLLDALTDCLKYQGYDGAGMATVSLKPQQPMAITKFSNMGDQDSIELVKDHSSASAGHSVGIAHTRWATHGGKTDENAHPHTDSSGKIAIVHNGTLNNANELRRELKGAGHQFKSQTDTEVIAKLIGHYWDTQGISVKEATEKALRRCVGTWGLCVMCSDTPSELVVACNGSPMVIGVGEDRTFVASENRAFGRYTKRFISMKDGEIGIVHADGRMLDLSRMQRARDEEIPTSPEPFPHWTLKEILEQPEAIARALGFGGRMSADKVQLGGLDRSADVVSKIKHMTLSGCGSSLNAAKYAEKIMKQLGSFKTVVSIDATDADVKDFPVTADTKETGLIGISQSGETKDLMELLEDAIADDITVMSVVNQVGSTIARTTKLGVYCNAGRENAVSSTKAFATQVTVLALIGLWFRQARDKMRNTRGQSAEVENLREALMRLPITLGMATRTRDKCKEVAQRLKDKEHCFILGKGFAEPIAMEGALKIKEMGYMHAEGYSGGALKHGPFALIEDENGAFGATPIIMLVLDDNHAHHMRTACEEVKARGAEVMIITDNPKLADGLDENPVVIPSNGPMTALGAVVPLQMIAYELSLLKGIDPDKPRNLVKVYSY